MSVFLGLRAFYVVQDLVTLVDARPNFLFASKACRVVEIANDAPIPNVKAPPQVRRTRLRQSQSPEGSMAPSRTWPPAQAANHAAAAPKSAAAPAANAIMTPVRRARAIFSLALAATSSTRRSASGSPSAEDRLPKSLRFAESDVIIFVVRASGVHELGYGHKWDWEA
jgi:hypothetical protein